MKRNQLLRLIFIGVIIITLGVIVTSLDRLEYEEPVSVDNEIVTIRFSSSWAGIDNKTDILEALITEFEARNHNIKIINESMYGEDFLFTLKANFASGNGPDIFGLWPGSDLELLIEKEMIADLSIEFAKDKIWYDQFDPQVFETLDQGYQIYSIPFEIIYEGLYLNLDLFEEYDIPVPEDYDGLIMAIREFRMNGIVPIAYNITPEGSFIYQNIITQISGKYATEHPLDHGNNINDGYIEAMYIMKDLYELGAFPDDAFILDDSARNDLFLNKEAAMICQGSWFNQEEFGDDIGLVAFPIGDDVTSVIYGIGNGNFHMSQTAYDDPEKQAASLLFLKFLTTYGRDAFNVSPSFVSSSATVDDSYSSKLGKSLIESADELVGPPDHYINRNFWESIIIKEFPNMLEGRITPEAIYEKLKEEE